MGLFDGGQSLTSTIGAGGGLISAVSSAASPDGLMSAIRSGNLPAAGEAVGDILGAVAEFSSNDSPDDWRVRLSIAKWSSFRSSPVLKPLNDAGALIFPYTPNISIASSATYTSIQTTHTNYLFNAFKNSDPGSIKITAPMNVEDQTQGLYWIAAVHYLRSLTKMFAGSDPKAGNPPPIVFLNGYGNYIFKNVPVVVKSFSTSLDEKSDYIGVDVVGSAAGAIQGVTDSLGGLADTLGGAIPDLSGVTSTISSVTGGIGQVAGLLGTFGIGGATSGGVAHVPTKSSFIIELVPMYSRDSARKFSLDRFVTGGYLNNPFGYI